MTVPQHNAKAQYNASTIRTRTPLSTSTFTILWAEIHTHSITDPDEPAGYERDFPKAYGAF